jgi:hypothetical protein
VSLLESGFVRVLVVVLIHDCSSLMRGIVLLRRWLFVRRVLFELSVRSMRLILISIGVCGVALLSVSGLL